MTGAEIWADAIAAASLFAVDPVGLGGISLRAGAGPTRDRWLKILCRSLPKGSPVRRLPLHSDDDRILGGLDLAATLNSGRPIVAKKGLLAEADGGVVILSMAERIEPAVAARLGNVMDQRVVATPRGGPSASAPARLGVIALDEGIAPDEQPASALLDRLAFHLDLSPVNPRDCDASALDEDAVSSARDGLSRVTVGHDAIEALCGTALTLGIQSLRAPLLALRAARVSAALHGRRDVTEADLALAGRLVFAARATCLPPSPDASAPVEPDSPPPQEDAPDETETLAEHQLDDVILEAARAALPPDLLDRLMLSSGGQARSRHSGRTGQFQMAAHHGRPIGVRCGLPRSGTRLHLLETLKAAAPWQKLRRRGEPSLTGPIAVRRDDFRIVRFRQRSETTSVFAVDASGSAALHRLSEAKGAVELLLADCYVRRDQVALIAFRGHGATLMLPPTGSLVRAKRCLSALPGGGATPLADGIDAAVAVAESQRRQGRTPAIILLTDGRANMTRDGVGGRQSAEAEALASARAVRKAGFTALLLDTSPRPNPFALSLAECMGARYVPLPYADASTVSRAVRSAAAA